MTGFEVSEKTQRYTTIMQYLTGVAVKEMHKVGCCDISVFNSIAGHNPFVKYRVFSFLRNALIFHGKEINKYLIAHPDEPWFTAPGIPEGVTEFLEYFDSFPERNQNTISLHCWLNAEFNSDEFENLLSTVFPTGTFVSKNGRKREMTAAFRDLFLVGEEYFKYYREHGRTRKFDAVFPHARFIGGLKGDLSNLLDNDKTFFNKVLGPVVDVSTLSNASCTTHFDSIAAMEMKNWAMDNNVTLVVDCRNLEGIEAVQLARFFYYSNQEWATDREVYLLSSRYHGHIQNRKVVQAVREILEQEGVNLKFVPVDKGASDDFASFTDGLKDKVSTLMEKDGEGNQRHFLILTGNQDVVWETKDFFDPERVGYVLTGNRFKVTHCKALIKQEFHFWFWYSCADPYLEHSIREKLKGSSLGDVSKIIDELLEEGYREAEIGYSIQDVVSEHGKAKLVYDPKTKSVCYRN